VDKYNLKWEDIKTLDLDISEEDRQMIQAEYQNVFRTGWLNDKV
jgi:hypothetical protein